MLLPSLRPLYDDPELLVRPLAAEERAPGQPSPDLLRVVEPRSAAAADDVGAVLARHAEAIRAALTEHGGLLFRGFDVDQPRFEAAVGEAFRPERHLWMLPFAPRWGRALLDAPVVGDLSRWFMDLVEARSTGRAIRGDKVATLARDDTMQFLHHEYGIFFNVPRTVAFWCEDAPADGGETVICDAARAWDALPEALRERFLAARGIRYRDRNQPLMPPFVAPAVFRHPDTGACTVNFTGDHHHVAAEVVRTLFPGARVVVEDHDETFQFESTFLGRDGTTWTLSAAEIEALARAQFQHSVLLRWRRGDLLLLDNLATQHGRLNGGSPKKTLHVILAEHVERERLAA